MAFQWILEIHPPRPVIKPKADSLQRLRIAAGVCRQPDAVRPGYPLRLAGPGHPVADAALVEDEGGACRVVAEFRADLLHEGAHAPGPHPAQQRLGRHHPPGVDREDAQDLVLGGGERDGLVAAVGRDEDDREVGELRTSAMSSMPPVPGSTRSSSTSCGLSARTRSVIPSGSVVTDTAWPAPLSASRTPRRGRAQPAGPSRGPLRPRPRKREGEPRTPAAPSIFRNSLA